MLLLSFEKLPISAIIWESIIGRVKEEGGLMKKKEKVVSVKGVKKAWKNGCRILGNSG